MTLAYPSPSAAPHPIDGKQYMVQGQCGSLVGIGMSVTTEGALASALDDSTSYTSITTNSSVLANLGSGGVSSASYAIVRPNHGPKCGFVFKTGATFAGIEQICFGLSSQKLTVAGMDGGTWRGFALLLDPQGADAGAWVLQTVSPTSVDSFALPFSDADPVTDALYTATLDYDPVTNKVGVQVRKGSTVVSYSATCQNDFNKSQDMGLEVRALVGPANTTREFKLSRAWCFAA